MLSCKEVTKLVSESLDHKLPWWKRMNMRLHLSMCKMCSGFRKDLTHLREEARHHSDEIVEDDTDPDIKLPDDARGRMKRLLESNS